MNWTGGRLRRQSHNRPDSILRIQKQHFAKGRLKKRESNNKNSSISYLRSISHLRDNGPNEPYHNSTRNGDASWTTSQADQAGNRICTSFNITHGNQSHQGNLASANRLAIKPSSNAEEGTGLSYIDNIKQRLLHKTDWVGISPTRPVQVNFVPIEEKERIGKRRKLSSADRMTATAMTRRSTLHSKASFSFDGQWSPRMNPGSGSNIDIRIHTAETPLGISGSLQSPIRMDSSDSILLDDSIDGGLGERHASVNRGPSIEPDKQQGFPQSEKGQRERVTRSSSELLTDRSSTMPVIHRFTLDDQILAEKEGNSELNHSISKYQQLSPQISPRNRFANNCFDESEEQLSFSVTVKVDDRFSENAGSYGSNSDLLPQTQKIPRQLPPQPLLRKQPVFSTPFRTTGDTQFLDYKYFHQELPPQYPQETMSFFGQNVPTPGVPDGAHKSYYNHSSPIQKIAAPPNQDEQFSDSPPYIPAASFRETNNKPKEPDQSPEKPAPRFRFPAHWTPHHNEQQFVYAEEEAPANIPTSPFVIAAPRASSPFGRPRKALYAFDKDFTGASHQSDEHEEHDIPPYFNTPFHR
ncbi:uncharacterized protein TRUGW13939_04079 [Talaromyces rugulosus]|uniref:Uncharacterized protein n=1 Tax=Talaromyces rugulosus TaxID=121627 RepID=A0A7H8QTX6_TALRU|nr:uncharacterized protein TRUGW13939_04079 [Talaromyces rugulosus]QKX56971.1 hypothetical protein TRUGW13939_04079 [Talaromyces rugulosus]